MQNRDQQTEQYILKTKENEPQAKLSSTRASKNLLRSLPRTTWKKGHAFSRNNKRGALTDERRETHAKKSNKNTKFRGGKQSTSSAEKSATEKNR